MKSNFKLVNSFILASLAGLPLFSQIAKEISVYPFKPGTREDSLKTTTIRVKELLTSRQFFEKTYLRKELVFVPLDSKFDGLFSATPYLQITEVRQLETPCNSCLHSYNDANNKLKKSIQAENIIIKQKNKEKLRRMRDSPAIQVGLTKLRRREDYEILMSPKKIFRKTGDKDPRQNSVVDSIKKLAEQILLGKPHNIDGYVNSINYRAFDFTDLKMPALIETIIAENFSLCKKVVSNPAFSGKIKDATISYRNFEGANKLWVNTNRSQKTVFLSPYLIRAVFKISLYQSNLFKLAEEMNEGGDGLDTFFGGKTGASVKQIDSAYFSNFVESFSRNIFFVIGHELAHIYLTGTTITCDIETACDSYSAYFYLLHFSELELGLFESLLIKSMASNELDFWGNAINKVALQDRYNNLVTLRQTRDILKSRCKIELTP